MSIEERMSDTSSIEVFPASEEERAKAEKEAEEHIVQAMEKLLKEEYEEVYIPDPKFKAYLLEIADMDGDGILTKADIEAWNNSDGEKVIIIEHINNLEGIQYFTALEELFCAWCNFGNLDLSHCPSIKKVHFEASCMQSLKIKDSSTLEEIHCDGCHLKNLDVSDSTKLKILNCSHNKLKNIHLRNNSNLYILNCSNNYLKKLDVSHNALLTILRCDHNQLNELDVSKCPFLVDLNCSCNKLTDLKVNLNFCLHELDCFSNSLEGLDVSNCKDLAVLNVSYCKTLAWLAMGNSNTIIDITECYATLEHTKKEYEETPQFLYNNLNTHDENRHILWCGEGRDRHYDTIMKAAYLYHPEKGIWTLYM